MEDLNLTFGDLLQCDDLAFTQTTCPLCRNTVLYYTETCNNLSCKLFQLPLIVSITSGVPSNYEQVKDYLPKNSNSPIKTIEIPSGAKYEEASTFDPPTKKHKTASNQLQNLPKIIEVVGHLWDFAENCLSIKMIVEGSQDVVSCSYIDLVRDNGGCLKTDKMPAVARYLKRLRIPSIRQLYVRERLCALGKSFKPSPTFK